MDEATRPSPEALLGYALREEKRQRRGRLKIFFGAVAGVGKTYAMLESARQLAIEGHQILVGYAEPHIRPDTERLLLGLDILPHLQIQYRGILLREFDLDAALRKKPEIILIDELAHTNAPGMRHSKRWQDVMELLEAGIHVFTTLNAQHLESVNDVVAKTTGVRVQETLPDHVFEEADEVQLVDIPPEQLLQRLADGKIYRGSGADAALTNFFTVENLMALRELALRLTADRVDRQRDERLAVSGGTGGTTISERLLVCVGPSPKSADLIRAAARMAKMTHSRWTAVFVETPSLANQDSPRRRLAQANLQLAEELGARRVILQGYNAAKEIVAFARQENISRIIAGKPAASGWRSWLGSRFTRNLIRFSGSIAIDLIREPDGVKPVVPPIRRGTPRGGRAILMAAVTMGLITIVGVLLYHELGLSNINVIMLYLLGVMWLAARFGSEAGIAGAVIGVLAFDYTVVPPYYSFAVSDTQYIFTFLVMLLAGVFISTVTTRLREQELLARNRHASIAALMEMTQAITGAASIDELARSTVKQVETHLRAKSAVIVAEAGKPRMVYQSTGIQLDDKDMGVAAWVVQNGRPAGALTDTLPMSRFFVMPFRGVRGTVGALALTSENMQELIEPPAIDSLRALCEQLAVAIDRLMFSEESHRAWANAERESIRNTLLTSVSHDLRTPLSAIAAAASGLQEADPHMDSAHLRELAGSITAEAGRMDRLIDKLLRMTRLESGKMDVRQDILPAEELIASAIERVTQHEPHLRIEVKSGADLPPCRGDPELLEQVMVNLIENAAEHGRSESDESIVVSARAEGGFISVTVRDHGRGLAEDEVPHLFEKFYRSPRNRLRQGLGLGLAICRTIVQLHGGQISARNHPEGGAEFTVRIPVATSDDLPENRDRR